MKTALLFVILLVATGIQRGMSQWVQTNGPDNGQVNCMASMDTVLFAGTAGGLFVSTDRAGSWNHPVSELWGREITHLAVMGKKLFASLYFRTLKYSSDCGITWTNANEGLPSENVLDLAVLDTFLFAGTEGNGIYRSGISGTNWTKVNAGPSVDTVTSLAMVNTLLVAGAKSGAVFRSSDYGENWQPASPLPQHATVRALGARDTVLIAGSDSGRVFRSVDRGDTWVQIPAGLTLESVNSIALMDSAFFVGTINALVRVTDSSSSQTIYSADVRYRQINALHVLGGDLYAGTIGGVYRSTDRGESWTDGNAGMKNAAVQALAMDGTSLYAATWGGGVFRSSDRGNSWACSLKENAIFSFAFTKTHLYAGGWGLLYDSSRITGVLNILSYPDTTNRVWSLAVSGTTVYSGTESGGLFQTWYDGHSWHCPRIGFKDTSVNCLLLDGAVLYAGTAKGLYRSSDEGAHWTALNNGLTSQDIRALVFKGTDLFAGTSGGVFRSTDKGAAWMPVNDRLTNKDVLSFAVKDDNLFAGTWEGGVFLSEDNGATWKEVSHVSTFDSNFRIPGVVQAPAVDGTFLYAGERRTGLWRRPLSEMITSTGQQTGQIPFAFALWQNFPNPFNPSTTILYNLPARSAVRLSVFNVLGQEVAVLAREEMDAGQHKATFDAPNLASGVYYCRLQARPVGDGQARQMEGGLFLQTRIMLLLH